MGRASKKTAIYYRSRFGLVEIVGDGAAAASVRFAGAREKKPTGADTFLNKFPRQIDQYFQGRRRRFTLPLRIRGTVFQKKVWRAVQEVPFGETVSYRGLAARIGKPKAARAVAGALRENPLCVVIPCHRVIGKDGRMCGYSGGVRIKKELLRHEARWKGVSSS